MSRLDSISKTLRDVISYIPRRHLEDLVVHLHISSCILRYSRCHDQFKDTVGRSGWKCATSKWYLARSHTGTGVGTSFTYADGSRCTHVASEATELYVQTHTKVPMDDQAAYSTRMRTWHAGRKGREANGRRKEEDEEFVWGGLWR